MAAVAVVDSDVLREVEDKGDDENLGAVIVVDGVVVVVVGDEDDDEDDDGDCCGGGDLLSSMLLRSMMHHLPNLQWFDPLRRVLSSLPRDNCKPFPF